MDRDIKCSTNISEKFLEHELEQLYKVYGQDIKCITNYRQGDYCGGGILIVKLIEDDRPMYRVINCGHCSCFGPLENVLQSALFNKQEMLRYITNADEYLLGSEAIRGEFMEWVTNN